MREFGAWDVGPGGLREFIDALGRRKMVAEEYPARHYASTQQSLEQGKLDDIHWSPGAENPSYMA